MKRELLRMQQVYAGSYQPGGLNDFQFHIAEGEMVVLLGLSGAGKTVLYDYFKGSIPLKAGKVIFDGQECPVGARFPFVSKVLCVGQNSTLIPGLSVAENIFVINGKRKGWNLVWMPSILYRAKILLGQYAPDLKPHTLVQDLTPVQMRVVELLRAIENEVKMVLIDNAFQGIGQSDRQRLQELLNILKRKHTAILYETHEVNMRSYMPDKLVVLRRGKVVRTLYEEDFDTHFCRQLLMGNDNAPVFEKKSVFQETVLLRMEEKKRGDLLRGLVFEAKKGEIVGFYDMDNRRNVELMQILLGEKEAEDMEITFGGKDYRPQGREDIIRKRIGYLFRGPQDYDLVDSMNFMDNLTLPILTGKQVRRPFQNRKIARVIGKEYCEKLGINPEYMTGKVRDFDPYVRSRIFLERWVLFRPKMMLCVEPWADSDLYLRDLIYRAFMEMAQNGTTILIASQNMNELRSICDSIYVLNETESEIQKYTIF